MYKRRVFGGFLLLVALALGGCSNDGTSCDRCSSSSDCKDGYECAKFTDGIKRCANENTYMCTN